MEAAKLLIDEANLLEKWANESVNDGWSTHQVRPMRERAAFICSEIIRLKLLKVRP